MKKLIQICSLLSLIVVFTAVSSFAQSMYGTDVKIPFAFNVGDKAYDAGDYIVKVQKQATGISLLSIQDTKTDDIQQRFLNVNGDAAGSELKLIFATIGGQKFLSKVETPNHGYSLPRGKVEKEARRASGTSSNTSIGSGANF
ncbi:MAG TPA: hypothetical protein VGQ55_04250 [Pyrinomonadaceae bacterium]|jgi:hypothetical protein|nr:hypothetical protein [Pyrinomonadaceae bacterium]